MGLALSPDILQFGAVLVKVCVKDFAFALGVFAVLVVGSPKLVAPANEGGPCGQSTNVFAWALSVYRLDLDAVRATGGIDAELYARRVRMRLALFEAWVLLSIPLMVVYALNLNGGATEMGFSRISIANVWHDGPQSARLWATVAALWASQVAALRLVELHDIRAMGSIYREIAKAPAHHYAAVITGLSEDLRDERRLRTFFESAFRGNVLRVRLVRHLSVDPATAGDGEETGLEALTGKALDFGRAAASTVLGSEGFLRERVADFVTALRAVVKADARALEAAERELSSGPSLLPDALRDSGGARAAGAVADAGKKVLSMAAPVFQSAAELHWKAAEAREAAEAARLKILAIDEAAAAPAAAAVVVFSTLATAAAASNSPLGVPDRAAAPAKKGPATPAAKSPAARSPGKLVASPSARKPGRRHWLSGSLLDKLTTSVTGLTPRSRT